MFYIFFITFLVVAVVIIWRTWSRYTYYSGGNYKNGGQDVILWCSKSKDEIVENLFQKNDKDTLYYDLICYNEVYYLKIRGIKRLQKESPYETIFRMDYLSRENGTYIILKRTQIIYSTAFEAELYEFFVKKLNCIAKKEVS
ncbi:hypothetical protein NK118_15100 [Lachnospiraceae bacterium PAL227]|uniref:Uncharacterized protein n=1 Tax=Ohessyouella blattaphilus TaxID=2949333 RepID=A0ABT1EPF5_9FIRM|nr:hypothetical protein [Ohessyouella blattaphilus]MCP1111571.1 hypothetical protein [Ohessyouella blattaphilus]MCR8564965.1 hypothetical protein [Ohessyouella blattaphilus]